METSKVQGSTVSNATGGKKNAIYQVMNTSAKTEDNTEWIKTEYKRN